MYIVQGQGVESRVKAVVCDDNIVFGGSDAGGDNSVGCWFLSVWMMIRWWWKSRCKR